MNKITLEVIEDWDKLSLIASEWDDLLVRAEGADFFVSWEWVDAWYRAGNRPSIYVIVLRDDDQRLIALAPLYISSLKLFGLLSYRCLRLLGDRHSGAEYQCLIGDRSFTSECYDLILKHLSQQAGDWDVIWLLKLPTWQNNERTFLQCVENSKLESYGRNVEFAYLKLPQTVDAFWLSQSRSSRANKQRTENRIPEDNNISLVDSRDSSMPIYSQIETLFELHQKRWQMTGRDGAFVRRPALTLFFRYFIPLALERSWLRLYILEANGESVAVQMGLVFNKVFYVIQEGFDPGYIEGIGNLLRARVIEECIREGLSEYDFLEGYTEHKRRWGAKMRVGQDVLIWNGNLRNFVFRWRKLWPSGRFLKQVD